jgi:hypothetical protein
MSTQKTPKQSSVFSVIDSPSTPFPPSTAASFSERHQEHRHGDLEAEINRLSDDLSQQRKAFDKLKRTLEDDKDHQLAVDLDKDRMIKATEHGLKHYYRGDWKEYLRGYGILDRK